MLLCVNILDAKGYANLRKVRKMTFERNYFGGKKYENE